MNKFLKQPAKKLHKTDYLCVPDKPKQKGTRIKFSLLVFFALKHASSGATYHAGQRTKNGFIGLLYTPRRGNAKTGDAYRVPAALVVDKDGAPLKTMLLEELTTCTDGAIPMFETIVSANRDWLGFLADQHPGLVDDDVDVAVEIDAEGTKQQHRQKGSEVKATSEASGSNEPDSRQRSQARYT